MELVNLELDENHLLTVVSFGSDSCFSMLFSFLFDFPFHHSAFPATVDPLLWIPSPAQSRFPIQFPSTFTVFLSYNCLPTVSIRPLCPVYAKNEVIRGVIRYLKRTVYCAERDSHPGYIGSERRGHHSGPTEQAPQNGYLKYRHPS